MHHTTSLNSSTLDVTLCLVEQLVGPNLKGATVPARLFYEQDLCIYGILDRTS